MIDDLCRDLVLLGHDPSIAILGTGRTASWASYGGQLYRELMANGHEPRLVGHAIVFLWDMRHLAESDPDQRKEYIELLKLFASPKGVSAGARPFDSKGYLLWFISRLLGSEAIRVFPEELAEIKRLPAQIDRDWSLIVKRLHLRDPQQAKELVLSARPGTDHQAADQMCSAVAPSEKLSLDFLEGDWRALLGILMDVDQIEGHWIESVLVTLSNKYPRMVADFFQARLRKYSAMGSDTGDYRPLPLSVGAEYGRAFSEIPSDVRADLIREGIALVRATERGARYFYYNYLNLIAGRFIAAGHDVLKSMASSADMADVLVAAELIQHSYPNFVLNHPDIVETLLDSGTLSDDENYNDALSCLQAGSGVRSISRTIGTPSQAHIQLRTRAAEVKRRFVPSTRPYVFYEGLEQRAGADLRREELHDAEIMDQ